MKNNKPVKIDGICGFGHWPFNERMKGQLDAKRNQICATEDGTPTTPWVLRKSWCCDKYINQAYLSAAMDMEQAHREVYVSVQRLRELDAVELPEEHSSLSEQDLRLAATRKSKQLKNEAEKGQLRLHLAEIEARVEELDAALTHKIEQAEAILHSHILSYWEGVLSTSPAGELPVFPATRHNEPAGRASYMLKRDYLLGIIRKVTNNDHSDCMEETEL